MKVSSALGSVFKREIVAMLVAVALVGGATAASAQTYTVLFTYPQTSGGNTGILSPDVMSQGQDGAFYTTDAYDGTNNQGSVFKMTTGGQMTIIYSFCPVAGCVDGADPQGGVMLGFDGNLWGTTQIGGAHAAGTAFKITPTGTLTKIWDFANGTDESVPYFAILQGQDGNHYGVSYGQYVGQYGAFFKISSSNAFTALTDFNFTDGALPALPVQGTDGSFYGTAQFGGSSNLGVVYKATPAGVITVLHNFTGYPNDGTYPKGPLVQGNDGFLYGVTYEGGAHNLGTIFKISTNGKTYVVLHSFSGYPTDGTFPLSGLALGTDGNLYGGTLDGGTKNFGTLYETTTTGTETVLLNFCDPTCNGFAPQTPMVQHTNGKFYGNTTGNSLGGGVFFSFDTGLKPFAGLVTWTAKVGKTAEILGQGFAGTTKVSFNGTSAAFTVVSDTYLTATVPAGATTGFVTVTTPGATLKSNRKFLVTPQILSFSPPSGPVGTSVTITGVSLTGATKVTFGGVKATVFTVNSDMTITATVPTGAVTGKIQVTTPGGVASSATSFTVT
ncbi:MAG: IPT/TIG domain-containing protein [Acidobacteriia bacterium]|nr:IPT/TIG domain-containing protein [Terriglobia bacterium]